MAPSPSPLYQLLETAHALLVNIIPQNVMFFVFVFSCISVLNHLSVIMLCMWLCMYVVALTGSVLAKLNHNIPHAAMSGNTKFSIQFASEGSLSLPIIHDNFKYFDCFIMFHYPIGQPRFWWLYWTHNVCCCLAGLRD